jgi:hypothetical protein
MDTILELLKNGVDQLVGRLSGPLNFRLVVMPTVVTLLALRADWMDAREGRPAVLGAFITDPVERRRLFRSAVKDIGRVFVVAIVLDTAYQLMVFRWLYPGQVLIVAVVCAVVPYVLVRGPMTRTARLLYRKWAGPAHPPAPKTDTKARGPENG